ncbi:MAG: hypothetical protein PWQ12_1077 [Clostridiales bacterium]|jgi:diguanylate cyclase (GGDEF)-like protein|nr:hypothetical protein [Clostridiales bacterium]
MKKSFAFKDRFLILLIAIPALVALVASMPNASFSEAQLSSGALSSETAFMDASSFDFKNGILDLDGSWEIYGSQLLTPLDLRSQAMDPDLLITLPNSVSNTDAGIYFPDGKGYATLRKTVQVSDLTQPYGLKTNYFGSANKIWINGRLMFASGQVADNAETYIPQYMPAEIFFTTETPTIEVVIQVANYQHRRVRLGDVWLGSQNNIKHMTELGIIKESLLFGSLLAIAFYYFIFFLIQPSYKASLYLSIISLTVSLRGIVTSERVIMRLLPSLPGEWMMKLGYLPSFLILPLILLYIHDLFQADIMDRTAYWMKHLAVAFTVLVLVTPVAVYDFIFEYLRLVLILGAVISLLFIATHPIFKRHKGYPYLVLAGLIVLLTAVSDTLREYDYLQTPELMSFGFTCFIMIQALFLAWNFNSAYKRSSRLAGENAQMLEQITALNLDLETRIRARTAELERMNKRFEEMSKLDPLTNLPNRRYFEERFTQEWFRAERTQQPLAILMIDIDFFKKYNDTFGHVKGDDCLIDVTVAIKETLSRGGDFLARYGGEEFIVLLPNTHLTGAYAVGENICKAVLAKQFEHPDSELIPFVTVSVGGTAVLCNGPSQMESIINTADQALYNAKNTGRNRVVVRSFSYAHSLDPQ